MKTVLVTGLMGAGKSSVISLLEERFYPVFKADLSAKKLLSADSPCHSSLELILGRDCISSSGKGWDRLKIAEKIFREPELKKALEAVIHPLVRSTFKAFVKQQKDKNLVFYEAPLISEEIFSACDKSILLLCPRDIRKKRLLKKGWKEQDIEERWKFQLPDSKAVEKADFVIQNRLCLEDLSIQLEKILSLLDSD